ncbi:protein kinase [Candidatus Moduliflexus flocculans]|uniref:Protein kinase n=1 Tax=Candidatus Moduliflexus flocculans TaxID=1499966 RepID=A0A0S6W4D1_9BACT|nr:protein kinase [Candidatus Moduliflexus flocculans]
MLAETLFSLFVGDVIKNFYTQKAGDAALKSWKTYLQGNHDLQMALQEACAKTAATLAIGLVQESLLLRALKYPSPQLNREFAEMLDVRYVKPFCGDQPDSERQLRQNAKAQCKALSKFFAQYPFKNVSVEEIANLLYNVRFITNADLLRQQTQLTKSALRDAFSQAGLDSQFIAFLLFPEHGSGVLYDGIVYHFEEAIKSNERVSRMLAHFDRQQLAANARQTQQEFDGLKTQISSLEVQIVQHQQARKFAEVSAVAQQLDALEQQAQKADATLRLLQQNAEVWQTVETELTQTRQGFGLISKEIAGHFAELQDWLDTEFDEVKDEIKGHVSHEASEIMRFVRQELEFFFGAKDPAIQVEKHDFLSKTYRLWDRYLRTADAPLGQGGLAEVWKVCKIHLQSTVALKVLLPKYRHDPAIVARFFAEGKIMGMLGDTPGHHFTKVREMGRSADDEYFIEMDFVPGKTLHTFLKEQGAFAPPDALRLLRQLAAALRHAHERGIIHRDVKPQNIIVNADGQATLIDFGIAKRIDHDSLLTPGGEFYGTYQYAAPEQFDRKKFGKISERTDVYALGILGYQLLLNRFPFEAETQAEFIHAHCYEPFPGFPADAKISTDIVAFIVTCAQKQQDDRFQNMSDVETAIAAIFEHDAAEKYRRHCAAIIQAATISPEQQETLDDLRKHLALNRETAASISQEIREMRQQQVAAINAENERRAAEEAAERQRIDALKRQQEALKKAEEEHRLNEQKIEIHKQEDLRRRRQFKIEQQQGEQSEETTSVKKDNSYWDKILSDLATVLGGSRK